MRCEPHSRRDSKGRRLYPSFEGDLRSPPQGDGASTEQAAASDEAASVADVEPPAKSAAIPEVSWFDAAQPAQPSPAPAPPVQAPAAALAIAAVIEAATSAAVSAKADEPKFTVFKAGTIPPPTPFAGEDFSTAPRADTVPPADPLAAIKSLSEEERLALFT
jgi:hypothetical protein